MATPQDEGLSRGFAWAALAVITAVHLGTAVMGVHFGTHWDDYAVVGGMNQSVDTMKLSPEYFGYNGMYYVSSALATAPWLAAASPSVVQELGGELRRPLDVSRVPSLLQLQERLRTFYNSPEYLPRARVISSVLVSFLLLWLFLLMRALLPQRPWLAVSACLFAGLSWELNYHARFISIDALMAQFFVLELWALAKALTGDEVLKRIFWLVLATWAAALAFGCKVTGVFQFGLVLAVALFELPKTLPWTQRCVVLFGLVANFVMAFAVSTPVAFTDPVRVVFGLAQERRHYNVAEQTCTHCVDGWGDHVLQVLTWTSTSVGSMYRGVAVVLFLVCCWGAWRWLRNPHRLARYLFSFLAVWLAFMTSNRLFIARNYLILIPFLAVAFAFGVGQLGALLERHAWAWKKVVLPAAVCAVAVLNAQWLWRAARSIETTTRQTILADVRRELSGTGRTVAMSARLKEVLEQEAAAPLQCLTADETPGQAFVLFSEVEQGAWKARQPFLVREVFSSFEVNYRWYPTWYGNNKESRVYEVDVTAAKALGIPAQPWLNCRIEPGRPVGSLTDLTPMGRVAFREAVLLGPAGVQ